MRPARMSPSSFRLPAKPGRSPFRPHGNKGLDQSLNRQRGDNRGMTSMDRCAVYVPEELALLGRILDQVVQSLPPNLRTADNRAALAQNILACAATGERSPDKLRRAALMEPRVDAAA